MDKGPWCASVQLVSSRVMVAHHAAPLCATLLLLSSMSCGPPTNNGPKLPTTASASVSQPPEAIPLGRLPADVRPLHYRLALTIVPSRARFDGTVSIDIELDKPRKAVWIHGHDLKAEEATITPAGKPAIVTRYEQVHRDGVVKLTPATQLPAGKARLDITFNAPFNERLVGLYKVRNAGHDYAFTQFEPVWTRNVFPCFNEPAFKTRWDVTLTVSEQDNVIANTLETGRKKLGKGMQQVSFATTEPLPSYLIAFAVGPLDIVSAPDIPANAQRSRPLPFRGVAARGRGAELAYALKHTPSILSTLEQYFGIAYPYDKLDIIAVPDKSGAMENVGAVTFREWYLLFDEADAPISQKRAFASIMAHELAHMWFGNLITMPWWDDIWLNEAFATWMASRIVHTWRPAYESPLRQLASVHRAMSTDSLLSARQIRQPVARNNDIHAAFDQITYVKGGSVLSMFERWMGPNVFQRGLQAFMRKHRHGSATADDLLAALSEAAGKDVAAPFRTFLQQPGLPMIEVATACEEAKGSVKLTQSRFLPLGSKGDPKKRWQIPVCLRYAAGGKQHEKCTLLSQPTASVALEGGCPSWLMPNAEAAGYYQWSMSAADTQRLVDKGLQALSVREKMSLARSLRAAYERGSLDAATALSAALPLARDPHHRVATAPMSFLNEAHRWLERDPLQKKVEAAARKLYGPLFAKLGWEPRRGEPAARALLRRTVISFLASTGKDPKIRAEALRRGKLFLGIGTDGAIHREVIDTNLTSAMMWTTGEEADKTVFDALLTHLGKTRDEAVRGPLITALGAVRDPTLAARARALVFDKRLKVNEATNPIWGQLSHDRTRELTWSWLKSHIDRVIERLPPRRAGWLPGVATAFCSQARADDAKQLFEQRMSKLAGGPRSLATAVETVELCTARRAKHFDAMRSYFEKTR